MAVHSSSYLHPQAVLRTGQTQLKSRTENKIGVKYTDERMRMLVFRIYTIRISAIVHPQNLA